MMWQTLNALIGTWHGNGSGTPGNSEVERSYRFVLGEKFIEVRNKSVYPPQEKNLSGEVHEDFGMIGYDKLRKKFVFRQFHIEGFVNQYIADDMAPDARTVVFETESIENIPSGWRARETYQIHNDDEFIEIFELAAPDEDFKVYSTNHFQRVK
jgi:hypothetical protein